MIHYACDWCGKTKKEGATWILGRAAEMVGVTAVHREFHILSAWDESAAVDRLAVHFCSQKCNDKYVAQLFDAAAWSQPGTSRYPDRGGRSWPSFQRPPLLLANRSDLLTRLWVNGEMKNVRERCLPSSGANRLRCRRKRWTDYSHGEAALLEALFQPVR